MSRMVLSLKKESLESVFSKKIKNVTVSMKHENLSGINSPNLRIDKERKNHIPTD